MRRSLLVAVVLAGASGCVDVPDDPFEDVVIDEVPCSDTCEFPPPAPFEVELLPAVAALVTADNDTDLVFGNGPDDSNFWGFFLVRDVSQEAGTLDANPFHPTPIQPKVIHVEEGADGEPGAKVYVFGEDDEGESELQIYHWDPVSERFTAVGGSDEPNIVLPDDDTPLSLTGGDFDGDGTHDLVLGAGADLHVLTQLKADGNSFETLQVFEIDGTLIDNPLDIQTAGEPDNIQLVEGTPTAFESSSSFRAFEPPGTDDLVVAVDGAIRWLTYAATTSEPETARWRTVTEFEDFQEGVMSTMTSASLAPATVLSSNRRALVLGGAGDLDVTSIVEPGPFQITPEERYKWGAADVGTELEGLEVIATGLNENAMQNTDVLAVARNSADDQVRLYLVANVGFAEEAVGTPGTFGGDFTFVSPPFVPNTMFVDSAVDTVWVFAADGQCQAYTIDSLTEPVELAPTSAGCNSR